MNSFFRFHEFLVLLAVLGVAAGVAHDHNAKATGSEWTISSIVKRVFAPLHGPWRPAVKPEASVAQQQAIASQNAMDINQNRVVPREHPGHGPPSASPGVYEARGAIAHGTRF